MTYRVVRGEILVGDSVRKAGDFVPEAPEFASLHAYLSTQTLEKCYVDEKVLADFVKSLEKKDVEPEPEVAPVVSKKRVIRKKVTKNDESESGSGDGSGVSLPEHAV